MSERQPAKRSGGMSEATRRTVLAGAAGVGAAAMLAACGGSGGGDSAGGGAGGEIAKTSDIPVGGGKVFARQNVVVTQPTEGNFKAFSASCTHQGCTVESVSNGTINCPCHGSSFSVEDGSVRGGPAPRSLTTKAIKVEGGSISLG